MNWKNWTKSFQKRIDAQMDKIRWEFYRGFFSFHIFRYLVTWFSLVPVVVVILQDAPIELRVMTAGGEVTLNLALPFNWEVLWASSFLFVLALLIYFLRCPPFVRKYHSYNSYLAYGHDQRWLVTESLPILCLDAASPERKQLIERLITKNFAIAIDRLPEGVDCNNRVIGKYQTKVYFENQGKYYKFSMPILSTERDGSEIVEDSEKGVFWEVYSVFSGSNTRSRILILLLLFLSGLCFAWVFASHVWTGLNFVVK